MTVCVCVCVCVCDQCDCTSTKCTSHLVAVLLGYYSESVRVQHSYIPTLNQLQHVERSHYFHYCDWILEIEASHQLRFPTKIQSSKACSLLRFS